MVALSVVKVVTEASDSEASDTDASVNYGLLFSDLAFAVLGSIALGYTLVRLLYQKLLERKCCAEARRLVVEPARWTWQWYVLLYLSLLVCLLIDMACGVVAYGITTSIP